MDKLDPGDPDFRTGGSLFSTWGSQAAVFSVLVVKVWADNTSENLSPTG